MTESASSNVIKLYEGDPRCGELAEALLTVIYERAGQIPLVSTLGVLDLVKDEIIRCARES